MKRGNKNVPRSSCMKGCNLCCTVFPVRGALDERPHHSRTLCPGTNLSAATLISVFTHSGPNPPRQAREAWASAGRHGRLCGLQETHAGSPPCYSEHPNTCSSPVWTLLELWMLPHSPQTQHMNNKPLSSLWMWVWHHQYWPTNQYWVRDWSLP